MDEEQMRALISAPELLTSSGLRDKNIFYGCSRKYVLENIERAKEVCKEMGEGLRVEVEINRPPECRLRKSRGHIGFFGM